MVRRVPAVSTYAQSFRVRRAKADLIPAVVHLDGTARVQTLSRSQNPPLYDLIERFAGRVGIPILCNTSLNDRGEPIVNRIVEAINFCLRKEVAVAYINGKRLEFRRASEFPEKAPQPRRRTPFVLSPEQRAAVARVVNPHGLSAETLMTYARTSDLQQRYDIKDARHARVVEKIIRSGRLRDRGSLLP